MTVETFDIQSDKHALLSVTEAACEHFYKQLQKTGNAGIRFSLKQAGCTGYKYVVDEVADINSDDTQLVLDNGVALYIDTQFIGAIRGTRIDVQQQGLNFNLVMENPNVTDECGCGESFNIEPFMQSED